MLRRSIVHLDADAILRKVKLIALEIRSGFADYNPGHL